MFLIRKVLLQKLGNKKLSKAVSTKLTDEDYELCRRLSLGSIILTEKIKYPSVSELIRLLLLRILAPDRSHTNIPWDSSHPKPSFRFRKSS